MIKFNIQNGGLLTGLGLLGLALYQFVSKDFTGGVQSVLSALAAFGVSFNATQQDTLKTSLERKGMI